jgi:hypothetical protein
MTFSKLPHDRSEQPFRLHSIMKEAQSNNSNQLNKMFGVGSESSQVSTVANGNSPVSEVG